MDDDFELEFDADKPPGPKAIERQGPQRATQRSGRYATNSVEVPEPPAVRPAPPPGGAGGPAGARPRGGRIIAEDPEKARIVGRSAAAAQKSGVSEESRGGGVPAGFAPQPAPPAAPPPAAPVVFEGAGLKEVGTLKKRSAAEEEDDEFDYAFDGGKREGEYHKQVFRAKAMPSHLVSNVKQNLHNEVLAEGEEEEEEGEEGGREEEDEEEEAEPLPQQQRVLGRGAAAAAAPPARTSPHTSAVLSSAYAPSTTAAATALPAAAAHRSRHAPHAPHAQQPRTLSRGLQQQQQPGRQGSTTPDVSPPSTSLSPPGNSLSPLGTSLSPPGTSISPPGTSLSAPGTSHSAMVAAAAAAAAAAGTSSNSGLAGNTGTGASSMVRSHSPTDLDHPSGLGMALGLGSEGGEEVDFMASSAYHKDGAGGKPLGSWTTFAVSDALDDSMPGRAATLDTGMGADLGDAEAGPQRSGAVGAADLVSGPAGGGGRGGSGGAAGVGAPGGVAPAETDLPSYRLMQALHATPPSQGGTGEHTAVGPSPHGSIGVMGAAAALQGQALQMGPAGGHAGDAEAVRAASGGAMVPSGGRAPLQRHLSPLGQRPPVMGALDAAAAAAGRTPEAAAAGAAGAQAAAGRGAVEEEEWEAANQRRRQELAGPRGSGPPPLSCHEALLHFMALDLATLRAAAAAQLPPPPGLLSRMLCLGPPDLKAPLLREQLLQLLALAKLPFDDADPMHERVLGSVYAALTGKSSSQPRYGSHWADVGFQGQDPATDLRGCGMLGLLQLLYLPVWSPEGARKMHLLSRHRVHEFPLAIVSLNVTKWTLQALRSGSLHRAANAHGSAVEAAQQFYCGCMATFYATWLGGRKTMADSGYVLRDLEALALKKPGQMLHAAQTAALPDPPTDQ